MIRWGQILLTQHADIAEGVQSLASAEENCFAYYQPHCGPSFREAVNNLERFVSVEGPFDGIIAFSQATSLAAALLVERHDVSAKSGLPDHRPFKCAIFFSGRSPYIDAGIERSPEAQPNEAIIQIPTAHIWGANDDLEPGQPEALTRWCESDNRLTFIHQGGHEIPSSRDQEALVRSARIIRQAIDRVGDEPT